MTQNWAGGGGHTKGVGVACIGSAARWVLHKGRLTKGVIHAGTCTHERGYTWRHLPQDLQKGPGYTPGEPQARRGPQKGFYTGLLVVLSSTTGPATHRPCYTQALLHTGPATHRPCYTQALLHTGPATHRPCYTQALLHTGPATHRPCYTQALLRTGDATHGMHR